MHVSGIISEFIIIIWPHHSTVLSLPEKIEARKGKPLLDLLRGLGGWPVLEGDRWDKEAFDWQSMVTKLRQFNNDILVSVWVGPDIQHSDDHIVQV